MKNVTMLSALFSALLVFAFACNKTNNEGSNQLQVRLTDAPYNAQQVNVDIKEVRVNLDKDTLGWIPLSTNAKIYNLLGLQNGVDTLLTNPTTIPAGQVKEVRFILGTNNTIMINNKLYPLVIGNGDEAGLKIKIDKKLRAGINDLLVDFDAGLSIKMTTDSVFRLKPVLKLK